MAFPKTRIDWTAALFLVLDLLAMPLCSPAVVLGHRWLIGEAVALCLVLLPALLLARWTLQDTELKSRVVLQVLVFVGVFLFLIPEIAFALRPGAGWAAFLDTPPTFRNIALQCIALLAIPGVSAVQELELKGGGTPIPYDPPKHLVVSGLYRYIANPMQLSGVLVMTAWGGALRNPWLVAAGAMSFLYRLGIAHWDEGEDMKARFGDSWQTYQRNIPNWIPRLRPWQSAERPRSLLYVAESCGPCTQLRRWFEARGATGLEIVAAEDHPTRDLSRITYDPLDGSDPEEGICGFARGLEHINLGWALAGALLRLPGISHLIQILMDGSGLGPQLIPRRARSSPALSCPIK